MPLWGFCPTDGGAGACPQTATIGTLLLIDPLAGRVLIAATLVPVAVAALGVGHARAPGPALRVLL